MRQSWTKPRAHRALGLRMGPRLRLHLSLASSLLFFACSSAESARPKPSAAPARPPLQTTHATDAPVSSADDAPTQSTAPAPASSVDAPAELPDRVDGGDIDRPHMLEVLASGIGRFLSRVRVQAERDARGRFAGWRLEHLFPGEPVQPNVLRAGDTLLRVNGQSVERPEQLKTVWDSLVTSRELVLTVRRGGKQSEIRYRIVDPGVPEPEAAAPSQDASTTPKLAPTAPKAPSRDGQPASRTAHES